MFSEHDLLLILATLIGAILGELLAFFWGMKYFKRNFNKWMQ